jgi:hypothetical protein
MQYNWWLLLMGMYLLILVVYAVCVGLASEQDGKRSYAADAVFFGAASIMVLSASSLLMKEIYVKK